MTEHLRRRLSNLSREDWFHIAALTGLVLFHVIANIWFVSADSFAFYGDMGGTYLSAHALIEEFTGATLLGKARAIYELTPDNHGPVITVPAATLMALFGRTPDVAAMTNTIFLVILIFAVYALGKAMFGKDVGLLATVIVTFFPPIVSLSRGLINRLSLVAMVVLALWALVKSEQFSSKRYSFLFGLFTGLAALCKPEFSPYLAIPLLVEVLPAGARLIKERQKSELVQRSLNILLAVLIAFIIAAPWYSIHLDRYIITHSIRTELEDTTPGATRTSLAAIIGEVWLLGRDVLSDFGLWLFVICSAVFLLEGKQKGFLLGWLILPFTIFFTLEGRDSMCIAQGDIISPLYPAVTLIMAYATLYATRELIPRCFKKHSRVIAQGIVGSVISAYVILYLGMALSTMGGLPFLRSPEFVFWVRTGCTSINKEVCGPETRYCIDTSPLLNKAPNRFTYRLDKLRDMLLETEKVGSSQQKVFFFNRLGKFSESVNHVLRETNELGKENGFQEVSCLELKTGQWYGEPRTAQECSEVLNSADLIVLEYLFYKEYPCSRRPEYSESLNRIVHGIRPLLDEFELGYTVRIQLPASHTESPTSEIYVLDETNAHMTWAQRGIREPIDELLGVVLIRRQPSTTPTERDISLLEEWLEVDCEA